LKLDERVTNLKTWWRTFCQLSKTI